MLELTSLPAVSLPVQAASDFSEETEKKNRGLSQRHHLVAPQRVLLLQLRARHVDLVAPRPRPRSRGQA